MLNYIALAFIKYLMNGPWKAPGSSFPKIAMLVQGARLKKVLGVHWGWILALVLVVLAFIYFNKTKQGYEIAVVGQLSLIHIFYCKYIQYRYLRACRLQ